MDTIVKNPALLLLSSLVAHAHFRVTSIGEAIAIAALAALYAYTLLLDAKREKPVNEQVKQELAEIRNIIVALKVQKSFGR